MANPRKAYFAKLYLENKERITARNARYYLENLDKRRAYEKAYRESHREEIREKARAYSANNKEKIAERNRAKKVETRAYRNAHRANHPEVRVAHNLRVRIRVALKQGATKSGHLLSLLGCSIPELKDRLEPIFKPGMTWENYGPVWHIDHVKPCAKFDLTDPAQQRACFHYTNLQPLFAIENIKKGCR